MGVASMHRAGFSALAVFFGIFGLSACTGEENLGPVPIQKSQIKIFPSTLDVDALAEVAEFTVQRTDGQGRPSNLNHFVWRSLDPDVAQVDGAGRVVSLAQGTAQIEVRAATGEAARARVVVDQVPVRFSIASEEDTLDAVGQTYALRFNARDRNGFRIPRASVDWESGDQSIVTVDETGTVTSRGEGETFVRAKKRGKRDSTKVRVRRKANTVTVLPRTDTLNAIGQEERFRAYLTNSGGQVVEDDGFAWTSTNPGVATVTSSGLVRAVGAGTAEIRADMSGLRGSATVTVDPAAEQVTVSPASASIGAPGQTVQLTASAKDQNGGNVSSTYAWSSDRPAVATVDQTGLVTGVSQGTARIVATAASGAKGFASVSVGRIQLNITPAADTLNAVGDTMQFAIYPRDANGGQASCPSPSWQSTNTSVAAVNQLGQTLAKAAGTALIVVSACGVQDSASVTVLGGSGSPSPPPPPPPPPSQATPPELPRLLPALPTAYNRQVRVPAGGNLQAAIDAAQPGDEILLAPGASYGKIMLRNRGDQGWVRIATDIAEPAGVRVDTTANLAVLTCGTTNCRSVDAGAGARGWELSLLKVTSTALDVRSPIYLSHVNGVIPSHILIDRVYVRPGGDAKSCILGNVDHFTVRYSVLAGCQNPGQQTAAAGGWHFNGPQLYLDNYMDCTAQCLLVGGAARPKVVRPADISILRNHMRQIPGTFSVAPLETKDGIRYHVEGNVIEGGDFGVLFKSAGQGGVCLAPCGTEDVTFRLNIIRGSNQGINLLRLSAGASEPMSRVLIENVLIDHNGGQTIQILNAPNDLVLRSITIASSSNTYTNMGTASPLGNHLTYDDIAILKPARFGMHIGQASGIGDVYASHSLGTIYGHCSGAKIPVTCSSSVPSTAGADLAAVNAATAGVVR